MFQIDNPSASSTLPPATPAGVPGYFTDGSPSGGVDPTILPAEFLNMVMLELINIVSVSGLAPSKASNTQVAQAIRRLIQKTVVLSDAGVSNTYVAANTPALISADLVSGLIQRVSILSTNAGPSTYAPDGLPSKPIYGLAGAALQGGELPAKGVATWMYVVAANLNSGNGAWILLECTGGALQVAAASQSQHAPQAGQVASGSLGTALAGGAANAVTASFPASPAAFVAGQSFTIIASAANTGVVNAVLTLGGTAQASVPMVKGANLSLAAGDIPGAGYPGEYNYSAAYGALVMQNPATGVVATAASGFRNRLINGAMSVDQVNSGAAQTIVGGTPLAYCVDQWYAYCSGANATGQRVSGTASNQYQYRFTGAASVSAIGFGQRIEQLNSFDMAGQTAMLSVDLANSVLTTVNWVAYYANTADTFGTLASPSRTQIATGSFTVSPTLARYSTPIAIPSAATTGIEVVFSVGAQTSGTWTIGEAQLEVGASATSFERRPYQYELSLCQRYFESGVASTTTYNSGAGIAASSGLPWKVTKRASPTVAFSNQVYANASSVVVRGTTNISAAGLSLNVSSLGVGVADFTYTSDSRL